MNCTAPRLRSSAAAEIPSVHADTKAGQPPTSRPTQRLGSVLLAAGLVGLAGLAVGCGNEVIVRRGSGDCPAGSQDNDADGICLPTCAAAAYDCSGHGTCSDASGMATCVCDAGWVPAGPGTCEPGESECAAPLGMVLRPQTLYGASEGGGDDFSGSCAPMSGEEVVYRFDVVEPVTVTFHAEGFETVLYLRSDCNDPSSELGCATAASIYDGATLARTLTPGGYYLFVDGMPGSGGSYSLTVEVDCGGGLFYDPYARRCVVDPCVPNPCTEPNMTQCVPVQEDVHTCECDAGYVYDPVIGCVPQGGDGDTCDNPIELPIETGSVTGTTVGALDAGQGSCGGVGADRVYHFRLTERMRARFRMNGGGQYDTLLHLRTVCESAQTELGCNDDSGGTDARLLAYLDPGDYYLFADSFGEPGAYELEHDFRSDPCDPDPCPGTPECVPSDNWSSYECVCPLGTLPWNDDCVDDPCDPNPCTTGPAHRTRCEADLSGPSYECLCAVGYVDDSGAPNGACVEDPNAKDWAFFVYLNADNDLEPFGYDDLEEMEAVGSTDDVDIVVLMDTDSGDGGDARRLHVQQGSSTLVENVGEIDMGSWQTLAEFGAWAVTAYPARHQALVLWDHGDGWRSAEPTAPYKAFSNDYHGTMAGIRVSNGDYGRALQAITAARGDKLDLVGFDACLMGMWEVAEATAPYALRFVASEETIPAAGWPYDAVLAPLAASPSWSATQFGTAIVDAYHDDTSWNSTLALSDLEALAALRAPLSSFADALVADPSLYGQVESARQAAQTFYYSESFRDLRDLTTRVRAIAGASTELQSAADAVLTQLGLVVLHSAAQSDYPGAYGLSIYAPARNSGLDPDYLGAGAVWSQATTWDEFLQSFAN